MSQSIPFVWYIAMGVAFGLLLGYAIGMTLGFSQGKQQLVKRIKFLVSRKKMDFDINKLLRG